VIGGRCSVPDKPEPTPNKPKEFDPFAAEPRHAGSGRWLWATGFQALITTALLVADHYAHGHVQERTARLIITIGIIATWSLALRTIRERLLELMRHWQAASRGLLKKCSESGRHLISVKLNDSQEQYIKGSIWRLRIIAAGITIPFFVMPFIWSFISVFMSYNVGPLGKEAWAGIAMFMMVSAFIVAGYFHWVILPAPVPVRVSGRQTQRFRRR
jgi:hypothetical protein